MRHTVRQALGGTALLVTLGFGAHAGATPPDASRPTVAPPTENPFGATPENPYAASDAIAAAPAAPPRDVRVRAPLPARSDATSAAPAPTEEAPEPARDPAPAPESPADMAALAERAAAEPPPPTDDQAIAALDAVLADDSADPISGVPDRPDASAEAPAGPTRDEVMAAMAAVTPALRACAEGQEGRVVNVRAVFRSNGRIATTNVESSSSHVSPSARSCMARAARAARVPSFELERFEVTFPVRL